MNQFLLRPLNVLGRVTDEQVDQLRVIPGLAVSRVLTYIVAVCFDGDAAALQSFLAGTAWDPGCIGKSRTYRLQTFVGPVSARRGAINDRPQLDDVLMRFAT